MDSEDDTRELWRMHEYWGPDREERLSTNPEQDLFPRVAFLAIFPSPRNELYKAERVNADSRNEARSRLT